MLPYRQMRAAKSRVNCYSLSVRRLAVRWLVRIKKKWRIFSIEMQQKMCFGSNP